MKKAMSIEQLKALRDLLTQYRDEQESLKLSFIVFEIDDGILVYVTQDIEVLEREENGPMDGRGHLLR